MNRIINAFHQKPDSQVPIWLMRQAGRYLPEYQALRKKIPTFMELCFHEDYATEITLQPLRRFEFDAAILFSDILVIPHVLGQEVRFIEKQGPILSSLEDPQFFHKAKDVNLKESLETPLKILRNVRKALPSIKAVIGFAGSPWTIATYMLEQGKSTDFKKIISLLEMNSPLFLQTMALLEESVGTFLIAQIEAGADVVQIFDTWAKVVPNAHQENWIIAPIRRIITRIKIDYPDTPIVYYGRGIFDLYPQIIKGFSNISFGVDETVPISVMKDQIQKLAPIQGNLCPQVLLEGGAQMKDNVEALLQAFRGTPYVFNLGHGIVPQTPVDHVARLVDLVKKGVQK
jgi:uroporphyrinogen decarboxylase